MPCLLGPLAYESTCKRPSPTHSPSPEPYHIWADYQIDQLSRSTSVKLQCQRYARFRYAQSLTRLTATDRSTVASSTVMDNIRPQDLPAFLDPLLNYLADHLPSSLYNTLFTALSYSLMLLSGLLSLVAAMPSWKPWEWDAQKVIPPLIVFLTAYYTLLNIYRTTSFMVRMTFRLMKWGAIFGLLGAGIGWLSGSNGGPAGASRRDASRSQGQNGRRSSSGARPGAWDSFADHRQWQHNEQEARRAEQADSISDTQRIIQQVADYAGRAMGGSAFDIISGAKSFLDRLAEASPADSNNNAAAANDGQSSTSRRRKTKASTQRKSSSR